MGFVVLLMLLWSAGAGWAQGDHVCMPLEVGPGLPAAGRGFACSRAQFEDLARERARRDDLMGRAAAAQRRQAEVWTAERESAAEAARHANPCARPDYASRIIEQTNLTRAHRQYRDRVVDIAAATTLRFDPASRDMTCRMIFLTAEGKRVNGVLELRRNAAGEPIAIFSPDRR